MSETDDKPTFEEWFRQKQSEFDPELGQRFHEAIHSQSEKDRAADPQIAELIGVDGLERLRAAERAWWADVHSRAMQAWHKEYEEEMNGARPGDVGPQPDEAVGALPPALEPQVAEGPEEDAAPLSPVPDRVKLSPEDASVREAWRGWRGGTDDPLAPWRRDRQWWNQEW